MEETLLQQILKESVWITALLFGCFSVIRWLAKRYEKAEDEKSELAKEVIKLTVAYETKLDTDKLADAEIKLILIDIRETVKNWNRK
jgi:hypothetical protein